MIWVQQNGFTNPSSSNIGLLFLKREVSGRMGLPGSHCPPLAQGSLRVIPSPALCSFSLSITDHHQFSALEQLTVLRPRDPVEWPGTLLGFPKQNQDAGQAGLFSGASRDSSLLVFRVRGSGFLAVSARGPCPAARSGLRSSLSIFSHSHLPPKPETMDGLLQGSSLFTSLFFCPHPFPAQR